MKISPDTREAVLFIFGCMGIAVFGLIMPALGYGFNAALFAAWTGIAGVGAYSGLLTSRRNGKNGNGSP